MAVTFSTAMMFTTSCSKEKGCTDLNAKNYSETAKEDDGSCVYEGEIVFWYGKATADSLTNIGSVSLTYYVDNDIVGSSAADVYYTSTPDCGANGTITVTKDLGCDKSKSYSYKIIDQDNDEIWSGTVNFNANTCTAIELVLE